jgi:hypothetical protein
MNVKELENETVLVNVVINDAEGVINDFEELNDMSSGDISEDEIRNNEYVRGTIDVLVTVRLSGKDHHFTFQDPGYNCGLSLASDNHCGGIAEYIFAVYGVDENDDEYEDRFKEVEKKYIGVAQEAFDSALDEIISGVKI